jgi:hypothetical protein
VKFTGIAIPGYALDKNGKPKKSSKGMSVSQKIKQRTSKKVRPVRSIARGQ